MSNSSFTDRDQRILNYAVYLYNREYGGDANWEAQSDSDIRSLYITRAQRSFEHTEPPRSV